MEDINECTSHFCVINQIKGTAFRFIQNFKYSISSPSMTLTLKVFGQTWCVYVCVSSLQVMEKDKHGPLISEERLEQGFPDKVTDIIKQHFQIICSRELLQNPQLHGLKSRPCSCGAAALQLSILCSVCFPHWRWQPMERWALSTSGWRWPTRLVQSAVPLQILPWVCFWHRHGRQLIVAWNNAQMPITKTC